MGLAAELERECEMLLVKYKTKGGGWRAIRVRVPRAGAQFHPLRLL